MYLHPYASKTFYTDKTEHLDKNKWQIYTLKFSRRQEIIRDEWNITLTNTQITFCYMQHQAFSNISLDKFRT